MVLQAGGQAGRRAGGQTSQSRNVNGEVAVGRRASPEAEGTGDIGRGKSLRVGPGRGASTRWSSRVDEAARDGSRWSVVAVAR